MKKRGIAILTNALVMLYFLCACSTIETPMDEKDNGLVKLNVSSEVQFLTKATSVEDDFKDVSQYTINVLNSSQTILHSSKYADRPEFLKLEPGEYTFKAFKGSDEKASFSPYVEGLTSFTVVEKDTINVSLTCVPTSVKVIMNFDLAMDDYFSDYKVSYKTELLETATTLEKTDLDKPFYLKTAENKSLLVKISLTTKDGKVASSEKTYTVSPKQALTIKVEPVVVTGNLGITIEIDDSTNDKEIIVDIPAEWL